MLKRGWKAMEARCRRAAAAGGYRWPAALLVLALVIPGGSLMVLAALAVGRAGRAARHLPDGSPRRDREAPQGG